MNIFIEDWLIRTLYFSGTYLTIWPLRSEDGKFKIFFFNCLWWFYTINMSNQIFLIIRSANHQENYVNILKSLVEEVYALEIVFDFIYCRIRRKQLQKLLFEIERPDIIWTPNQQIVRAKFMRRLHKICVPLWTVTFVDLILYTFSPLVTDRILPLNIEYPFRISNFWIYCLAYVHNTICMMETFIVPLLNLITTMIMWQVAFKFYLLGTQMRLADTAEKLRTSITEYQNIISHVKDINSIFNVVILKTAIITFIDAILCSLLVLNNAPIVEIFEFCALTFIAVVRLFICCWAAEEITNEAYNVAWQIYGSPCMYISPNARQNVYMLNQRCQMPVVISASHFVPAVSIRFCGNLLYTTFSYFMALRAVL